jgi:FtsZ-binding cell division protein ZapB
MDDVSYEVIDSLKKDVAIAQDEISLLEDKIQELVTERDSFETRFNEMKEDMDRIYSITKNW